MVRNKIPPNPINYTLWYHYVAENIPPLNKALDKAISDFGTCDSEMSQELFLTYIIGEHIDSQQQTLEGLTELASKILSQLRQSSEGCSQFDQQMEVSMQQLEEADSAEDIHDVVSNMLEQSRALKNANRQFREQVDAAHQEIDDLQKELKETQRQAFFDQLTKLYNRHSLNKQLDKVLSDPASASKACIILTDVDHFKSFNDEYGHLMGDQVLQRIGAILQEGCPENAFAARYGGEEFAILVSDSGIDDSVVLAEQLRSRVESLRVKVKGSDKVLNSITASFGVARYEAGESTESFIHRADTALYDAKRGGRNRVETANQELLLTTSA